MAKGGRRWDHPLYVAIIAGVMSPLILAGLSIIAEGRLVGWLGAVTEETLPALLPDAFTKAVAEKKIELPAGGTVDKLRVISQTLAELRARISKIERGPLMRINAVNEGVAEIRKKVAGEFESLGYRLAALEEREPTQPADLTSVLKQIAALEARTEALAGPVGSKGDKGKPGERGPKGEKGDPGPAAVFQKAAGIRIGVVPCITDCGSNMGSTVVGNVPQTAAEGTLTGTDTDVTTDLVGSIVTVLTATTFNNRTTQQLRLDFDVLAFPRAADQTLPPNPDARNVAWTRLEEYLDLGGSIVWEDPIHIGGFAGSGLVLQPSAVGGGAAISASVPGLTDGILNSFFNSHMRITSFSSAWTQFLQGGGSNVGVYRDFASGGRMILTGTDQMTKAIKNPAPGTSNLVAAANQYALLLNEFRFSVANQVPFDRDSDGVADANDNCPTVSNPGQEQTGNNVGGPFGDACVDPGVDLTGVGIGANPIVGEGTTFEDGVVIGDNAVIGENVQFKKDAMVGDNFKAGDEVIIEVETVIGNDVTLGFKVKIEENVVIQNDVEIGDKSGVKKEATIKNDALIGSSVTIEDRAAIGVAAEIGDNAKIEADAVVPDGTVVAPGATFPA